MNDYCPDCLYCKQGYGDCRVPEHERCETCGHCTGNQCLDCGATIHVDLPD